MSRACVWMETLQLPSKEAASATVTMATVAMAATAIAAIFVARTVGVGIIFMGTTFSDKFHNLMTFR